MPARSSAISFMTRLVMRWQPRRWAAARVGTGGHHTPCADRNRARQLTWKRDLPLLPHACTPLQGLALGHSSLPGKQAVGVVKHPSSPSTCLKFMKPGSNTCTIERFSVSTATSLRQDDGKQSRCSAELATASCDRHTRACGSDVCPCRGLRLCPDDLASPPLFRSAGAIRWGPHASAQPYLNLCARGRACAVQSLGEWGGPRRAVHRRPCQHGRWPAL